MVVSVQVVYPCDHIDGWGLLLNTTAQCHKGMYVLSHSVVSNSAIPWTVAHQAPLSTGILQARI